MFNLLSKIREDIALLKIKAMVQKSTSTTQSRTNSALLGHVRNLQAQLDLLIATPTPTPTPTTSTSITTPTISAVYTRRNGKKYLLPMATVLRSSHPLGTWELCVVTDSLESRVFEDALKDDTSSNASADSAELVKSMSAMEDSAL
jgi:hypothetical protein